jgi:hypothetical protein
MRILARALEVGIALCLIGCGGSAPMTPSPPPPANNLPVIDGITIQGTRPKEPSNFADLGEAVQVSAAVHDDETPADQLQYQWNASTGSFSGSGARVTWTAPTGVSIPADVMLSLTVTERYGGTSGTQFSHDVTGSANLSLHDSVKEVGDMARQFLLDFSDSTITDVSYVMRNFDPACDGTTAETMQVADNRRKFSIVRSSVGAPLVKIPFGDSFCAVPGRVQRGDACSATAVHWESTVLADRHSQIADGTDWISAYYRPALKAWKLCDSQFTGTCIDATTGGPCTDAQAAAMVAGSWRER